MKTKSIIKSGSITSLSEKQILWFMPVSEGRTFRGTKACEKYCQIAISSFRDKMVNRQLIKIAGVACGSLFKTFGIDQFITTYHSYILRRETG